MRRSLALLAVLLALLVAFSSCAPRATSTSTLFPTPSTTALPEDISGEVALRHVQELAGTIGPRPTGTPSEQAAADYIAGQLESYGYSVERQPFSFEFWRDMGSSLRVASPEALLLPVRAMPYSSGGEVTASLVDVGLARPQDFPAAAKGAIVLAQRGEITFKAKADNAAAVGARGLVIYNNQPGPFEGHLGEASAIPVVAMSQEDGQVLKALLSQGPVQASLSARAGPQEIKSQNVIARVSPQADCSAVVGGHYDSVEAAPGANDNASGTATVLEIARVAAPKKEELGQPCFIAFGSEELGLWGSRYFVSQLSEEERQGLKAMLDFDMEGVGDGKWFLNGSSDLAALAQDVFHDLGAEARELGLHANESSDHYPFIKAGIPAILITSGDDPHMHTPEDTVDYISAQNLAVAAKAGLGMLQQIAHPIP